MSQQEAPKETGEDANPVSIIVFDETDPGNLMSDISEGVNVIAPMLLGGTEGDEGFHHNAAAAKELAEYLIHRLDLSRRGAFIDIGYGSNIHVANTFAENHIDSFALDKRNKSAVDDHSMPELWRTNEFGVKEISGDVVDIEHFPGEFPQQRFGLILFNGSWESGGNNYTVNSEESGAPADLGLRLLRKTAILRSCIDMLVPGGLIGIISSRYAFHGQGYSFENLPKERSNFLKTLSTALSLGLQKLYVFGVTHDGMRIGVETSRNKGARVAETYKDIDPDDLIMGSYVYPSSVIEAVLSELRQAQNNSSSEFPQLDGISRIDALFMEFS